MHHDRQQADGSSSQRKEAYAKPAWDDTEVAKTNLAGAGSGHNPELPSNEKPAVKTSPSTQDGCDRADKNKSSLSTSATLTSSTSRYGKVEPPCEFSWKFVGKVLFVVGFFAGEKTTCLLAPGWLAQGFGQAPFDALRGLSLGWIYTMFVEHQRFELQLAGIIVFSISWTSGPLLPVVLGRGELSTAGSGVAILLWYMAVLPFSTRKLAGLLAVAWGILINVALVYVIRNFLSVQQLLPVEVRGLAMPVIVMVYDVAGSVSIASLFRRFGSDGVSSKLFLYVSAQVIMTAEALRIVGFLSALASDNMVTDMLVNTVSSCSFDLVARTSIARNVFYRVFRCCGCCGCCGWSKHTSAERDLQMRARFAMSYIPFIALAVQLPIVYALKDISYLRSWEFWIVLLSALVNEMMADLFCLLSLRKTGESLVDTFCNLQRPGGHRSLQFSDLAIVPVEDLAAPKDNDPVLEDDVEDTGRMASIANSMGWWYLLSFAAVMVDMGMGASLGQCEWNLPDQLCTQLNP